MKYFYFSTQTAYVSHQKKYVYREKISSDSENLIALILIFLTHKKRRILNEFKTTKTYLNETMAEKQERQKCMS